MTKQIKLLDYHCEEGIHFFTLHVTNKWGEDELKYWSTEKGDWYRNVKKWAETKDRQVITWCKNYLTSLKK